MPDLLIKDVTADDKERLRVQAARNRHSMQEELRSIIHEGVNPNTGVPWYASLKGALEGLADEGFALPERQAPKSPMQFE